MGRYGPVNRDERITVRFTSEEIEALERARGDSRQLGMFGRSRKLAFRTALSRISERFTVRARSARVERESPRRAQARL
jgi:hypothetical protein